MENEKNYNASSLMPVFVLILGGAMLAVFRLFGALDRRAIYGAALGCCSCIINLLLLHAVITRASAASSQEEAARIMQRSVPPRMLLVCFTFYFGFTLPIFNPVAVAVPFLFPRLSALLMKGAMPMWSLLRSKLPHRKAEDN